jgi:hypothetical protein
MSVTCFKVINLGVTNNINKSMMCVYENVLSEVFGTVRIMIEIMVTAYE